MDIVIRISDSIYIEQNECIYADTEFYFYENIGYKFFGGTPIFKKILTLEFSLQKSNGIIEFAITQKSYDEITELLWEIHVSSIIRAKTANRIQCILNKRALYRDRNNNLPKHPVIIHVE